MLSASGMKGALCASIILRTREDELGVLSIWISHANVPSGRRLVERTPKGGASSLIQAIAQGVHQHV